MRVIDSNGRSQKHVQTMVARQWLSALLLCTVNIEQSKLLAFDDLKCLLGQVLSSTWPQRQRLVQFANEENLQRLFNLNSQITKGDQLHAYLMPTPNYAPAIRKIMHEFLENLNKQSNTIPDESGRKIIFHLGIKSGIQIAI